MNLTTKFSGVMATALLLTSLRLSNGLAARGDFLGSLHFNTELPQGELRDHIDSDAFGVAGQVFYAPTTSPLAVGLDLGWANYGTESRREPFSATIPDVTVDVDTWNNLAQGFFVLRGQVPSGPVQAYADALVGFNYLYTETTVKEHGGDSKEIASSTNQDDVAFAYGLGGGVMVPVWQGSGSRTGLRQVSIDAGARHVWGGQAQYLKKGSIRRDAERVTFDTMESRTDLTSLRVGVAVRF